MNIFGRAVKFMLLGSSHDRSALPRRCSLRERWKTAWAEDERQICFTSSGARTVALMSCY